MSKNVDGWVSQIIRITATVSVYKVVAAVAVPVAAAAGSTMLVVAVLPTATAAFPQATTTLAGSVFVSPANNRFCASTYRGRMSLYSGTRVFIMTQASR